MSSTRTIKCHFYRVILPPDQAKAISDALSRLNRLPKDDPGRITDAEGRQPIKLDYENYSDPLWLLDMVRIRMDIDAKRASKKGPVKPVVLEEHEGMAEESAVLYDPTMQIMILQAGRETVSRVDVETYFATKAGIPSLDLQPALVKEGYLKMQKMKEIRKLEVSVAGLSSGTVWKSEDLAVQGMAAIEKRFESPSLTFSVSMARKPGGLSNAIEGAAHFIGLRDTAGVDIRKVMVSGVGSEDEPVLPFNLLPYSMSEPIKVNYTGRVPTRAQRLGALRQAWTNRIEEIRELHKGATQ